MSWGNGNKGPWGRAPGGGGGEPPRGGSGGNHDLDELIRKSQESFKGMFGGGGDLRLLLLGVVGVMVLWLASGIYLVNADEAGVVLRFGKYHRVTEPGLNYHLPYPVESVQTPKVEKTNQVQVGMRAGYSGASGSRLERESMMLTGDRNIVDINFDVQWKIDAGAPQDFLFNVRNASLLIKPVAESAMREVIGQNVLEEPDEIDQTVVNPEELPDVKGNVFDNQLEIAERTKSIMQQMLDAYEAGIQILSVNLSRPDVPSPVIDEFQDIKRAEQDKRTAENVAEGYRNEIVPRAKGQAAQMNQEALAYKNRVIAEAEGDVSRFLSVYDEYKLARDVTKKRIYLETMEDIYNGMQKLVIDQAGSQGVLPYLPLKELKTRGGE